LAIADERSKEAVGTNAFALRSRNAVDHEPPAAGDTCQEAEAVTDLQSDGGSADLAGPLSKARMLTGRF
jgi:hypothetical protein